MVTLAALFLALIVARPAQLPLVVHDITGAARTPLAPAAGETNVLLFITVDCPISNRYAPEIARIAADYAARPVRLFLVYADPTLDIARVRAHVNDFYRGTTIPVILDAKLALTSAVGATVTPEAVVYTSSGRAYRGRIDDWYLSLSQNRRAPTTHDLRIALDATLSGKPVPTHETNPVGCYISRYDK